jgi:hypothetical protein
MSGTPTLPHRVQARSCQLLLAEPFQTPHQVVSRILAFDVRTRAMKFLGGAVLNNQPFKDYMNSLYYPLANMQRSVDALKASKQINLTTMEWGEYQQILAPLDRWPAPAGQHWIRLKNAARADLSVQANTASLSKDEPVVPPTKCALLDAAVRKCFNSTPPIPMFIEIMDKPVDAQNANLHDITLTWVYGKDGIPTLLEFTMHCPFIPPDNNP